MTTPSFLLRRPVLSGVLLIVAAVVAAVLAFEKPAIMTALTPGETLTVQLARDYKITPYATVVKIAGTRVGVVRSVEKPDEGPVKLTLKLDSGTRALLGRDPSAEIRPTTVLGGTYYVQLHPGGDKGEAGSNTIPMQRTTLPIELDLLLSAIPPEAQQGLQGMTERLDSAFKAGAGGDLNRLMADAPATLSPAGEVAEALRGVNKDSDLASMVTNLNKTAQVLNATPGQLRNLVDSLAATSRVLGTNSAPIDRTIATLPDTLRVTRAGADDLAKTLDKISDTSESIRPSVRKADPLLRELDPMLADLRPVLSDLHPLLVDAAPLVNELVPTVDTGTDVLEKLNGPVLDRVNGPILDTLLAKWSGHGPKYPHGGGDGSKFYEEFAYMSGNLADALRYQNASSHMMGFEVGVGSQSAHGTGMTAQRLQDYLAEMYGKPHRPGGSTRLGPTLPEGIPVPDPGVSPPTVDPNKGLGR